MTEETITKPNPHHSITVNGEPTTIFMSGGLIRIIMPMFLATDDFGAIYGDFQLQNEVIVELLRPRGKNNRDKKTVEYTIDDFEMSQEDATALIEWTVEHVLNFFVDTMKSTQNVTERSLPQLQLLNELQQSMTGLQDSAATKLSAGATTLSPQE